MTQSGWRKPTPGLCRANVLAEAGKQNAIPKGQAMLAVRRVAPIIGLKPGDLVLLDTLVVFTKTFDWEKGARPIVWPSNDYLMDSTGFSLSAVKRRLRKLAELGLIAYKDSSNGKRWGRRDEEGRIVEAYGFDLSPLSARAEEFEALYSSIRAEREAVKNLKHKITILRRIVWAVLESKYAHPASELWLRIRRRYVALLAAMQRDSGSSSALSAVCKAFGELKDEAEGALRNMMPLIEFESTSTHCQTREISRNMDPTVVTYDPHLPITNDLQSVKGSGIENATASAATEEQTRQSEYLGDSREDSVAKIEACGQCKDTKRSRADGEITIQSIMYACPTFAEMARGVGAYMRNWFEFVAAAEKIRPMIGISSDAWSAAQIAMGRENAATAVALITDKYSEGTLSSPGGYLRALSLKAQKGDLHLPRSLFGRMSERQSRDGGWV